MTADVEDNWNAELESEVDASDVGDLIVYSRDWTVETILSQVGKDNIDLNPAFQRRNAWNDLKRSKLIESLVIGVPVPEIVLAEDQHRKRSFIVIDGKQRLLAIAGFADPETYKIWSSPKLQGLNTRKDLNGRTFHSLNSEGVDAADIRQLLNADIRCTIISNYKSEQVLYDIFYRLNSGSVPLSSQELRQVLHRGHFGNYLIRVTNELMPVHEVLNLDEPDTRLRDAEILLRYISFSLFGKNYTGNLTQFLDSTMAHVNKNWADIEDQVRRETEEFNRATQLLIDVLPKKKVGRKFGAKGWESRFNRALFEVQAYYVARLDPEIVMVRGEALRTGIEKLCISNNDFVDSIESSTKTMTKYNLRYRLFQEMINGAMGTQLDAVPVAAPK